jgi:hypothetical protein
MDALERLEPKERILKAMQVAARREPEVAPPFYDLWVPATGGQNE